MSRLNMSSCFSLKIEIKYESKYFNTKHTAYFGIQHTNISQHFMKNKLVLGRKMKSKKIKPEFYDFNREIFGKTDFSKCCRSF